jgi:hypothetical protein
MESAVLRPDHLNIMNRTVAAIVVVLAVAAAAAAGFFLFRNSGPRGSVTVTLRLEVSPADQVGFVAAQANSARFKYESGKQAGVRPGLAQKLEVRTAPNTSVLEMRLGVQNREEGGRYADSFVRILQAQCGDGVQLKLVGLSVH